MKANEQLMLGDWVLVHEPTCKGHRVDYINEMDDEIGADGEIYNICDIRPVPITPEILEKNGFETKDNAHYYNAGKIIELLLEEHPFIGYSIHWVKTIETINPIGQQCFLDYYIANLEYVHELQHALRLCGIEKEITS